MKKILNCIKTIEELDVNLYNNFELGVEIQDFTEPNLSQKDIIDKINQYRKLLKNFRGIKAIHGPFLDLKPASPDPLIRGASYKRYLHTLHIGSQLDIDYIIFHSQINPYLNHPSLMDLNNRQSSYFWNKILEEEKHFKGTILIENIFEEEPFMLKKYIETVNRDNVKVVLDIGHAILGKVSLDKWIEELQDYIGYMHIHSNDGKYDLHRALKDREIENLYRILEKYNIDVPLALEYKVDDLEKELKRYRI